MKDRRAVVYAFAYKCDVCGFEEMVEQRISFEQFERFDGAPPATTRVWQTVRAYSFATDYLDVCSETCYDKHLADYKDSVFRASPKVTA